MSRHVRSDHLHRSGWAACAAAVTLLAGGGLLTASAASNQAASVFVPITPCRLLDTRPANLVGSRTVPLDGSESFLTAVWGKNGNCFIPDGATGVAMNVVAINPTDSSYLTVYPADQPLPLSSNLNWVSGQPPTPNAVTTPISADGRIGFYNNTGKVDIAVDIVGYYQPATTGPAGPPGPPGPPGMIGPPAPTPASILTVATSGGMFPSIRAAMLWIGKTSSASNPYVIRVAPGIYTDTAPLSLLDYVDIEGSGQDTTVLTCNCGSGTSPLEDGSSATVKATGPGLHTELRHIAIANSGGGAFTSAIWMYSVGDTVSMQYVTATTAGGSDANRAVWVQASSPSLLDMVASGTGPAGSSSYGVYNFHSTSVSMTNVVASGTSVAGYTNYGVVNTGSSVTMHNVSARASGAALSYGVYNSLLSMVTIHDSSASGTTKSVVQDNSTVLIYNTELDGDTQGMPTCTGTYTAALMPYACQ